MVNYVIIIYDIKVYKILVITELHQTKLTSNYYIIFI